MTARLYRSGKNMARTEPRSEEAKQNIGESVKATANDNRAKCPRCELLIVKKIYMVGNVCNLCFMDGAR